MLGIIAKCGQKTTMILLLLQFLYLLPSPSLSSWLFIGGGGGSGLLTLGDRLPSPRLILGVKPPLGRPGLGPPAIEGARSPNASPPLPTNVFISVPAPSFFAFPPPKRARRGVLSPEALFDPEPVSLPLLKTREAFCLKLPNGPFFLPSRSKSFIASVDAVRSRFGDEKGFFRFGDEKAAAAAVNESVYGLAIPRPARL